MELQGSTSNFEGCITLGQWGGSHGKSWIFRPGGFIRRITIKHGVFVDSIEFETHNSEGEPQLSMFGGNGGDRTDVISLIGRNEYLTSVVGTIGGTEGCHVVASVGFRTNKKFYGMYGTNSGGVFANNCNSGVIVGFHGFEDKHRTAIGVYMMAESRAFSPCSTFEEKVIHEFCSRHIRMIMPRDAGPWGACGGNPFDDGVFSTIKQVRIHIGQLNIIYALQSEYLKKDGKSVTSELHGETGGSTIEVVSLDVKDEYLIGISGFYGPVEEGNELEAIVSICLHTNKRRHGPFGKARLAGCVYFSSTASPGKVIGFHGRNNGYLSATGVHMEYF